MSRPIWSGSISFGLVSVPVYLVTGREDKKLSFHMLDKKDHARIGYRTINKATGREIPRSRIVKGFEYKDGKFVLMNDEDFKRANPKKTKTIDIEEFVALEEVDPMLFEQPYYLIPGKNGEKAYHLLKEALDKTNKIAIGTFVMREREKLVAILPHGDFLVLEMLRFAHEVLSDKEAKTIHRPAKKPRVTDRELVMAESLIRDMTAKWNPEKYKDTYYNDVMKLIHAKVKGGKAIEAFEAETPDVETPGKVLDLMPLLKKSLEQSHHGGAKSSRTKTHSKRGSRGT